MPDPINHTELPKVRDVFGASPAPETSRPPAQRNAEGASPKNLFAVTADRNLHRGRLALHRDSSRTPLGSSVRDSSLLGAARTLRPAPTDAGDRAVKPVNTLRSLDVAGHDSAATHQRLLLQQQQANEQLVLAVIHAQECTDRAEALARRLANSERELQDTAASREQLLGIVAHDLRNPLGAISMCGQFLAARGKLDQQDSQLVARLLQSTQRMDRMIGQVFEFTRARIGGGITLTPAPDNLARICQNAMGELALGSAVPISFEATGDLLGSWDAERLVELLSNIIGNAIDHAAPGTPVVVRARGGDAEAVIEIHNQGPAIPDDLLPVLFVPFHRGRERPSYKRGHLGLGLYISHEIARAHGGTLTVQSGGGATTFLLRLPRFTRVL